MFFNWGGGGGGGGVKILFTTLHTSIPTSAKIPRCSDVEGGGYIIINKPVTYGKRRQLLFQLPENSIFAWEGVKDQFYLSMK